MVEPAYASESAADEQVDGVGIETRVDDEG
jgi:hypothetical protein